MADGTTVKPERKWRVVYEDGLVDDLLFDSPEELRAYFTHPIVNPVRTWEDHEKEGLSMREYLLVPIVDGMPWLDGVPERRLAKEKWFKGVPKE